MTAAEIAKNLLRGKTCGNCIFRFPRTGCGRHFNPDKNIYYGELSKEGTCRHWKPDNLQVQQDEQK